jgi:tryptophanase
MASGAARFFISKFVDLIGREPRLPTYYRPRPYRNAAVRFRTCSLGDFDERLGLLGKAGLNIFMFPSAQIPGCDLLSDSGTSTMTMEQWSAMLLGDEAYGSNEGYFELLDQIEATFGPSWREKDPWSHSVFLFHQGRAAEHALFTILRRKLAQNTRHVPERGLPDELGEELRNRIETRIESVSGIPGDGSKPYYIIPSNSHFDTTEANIESNNLVPLNLPCSEHQKQDPSHPFKGNMHIDDLKILLTHAGDRVPLVYLTITNNTGGGQPVSMANIKAVHKITTDHGIPLLLDACRFAENAWFIQQREKGYGTKNVQQIVTEMFDHADGFHISLKKDGLANIGGALVLRPGGAFAAKFPDFGDMLNDHQILTEGHPTYGGMAGRDLKAIVEGLKTVVRQEYLKHRIKQVERFGNRLIEYDIPILTPVGGHAVYIDVDRFFDGTATSDEDLKGISCTALLLLAGHRLCELGVYALGRYHKGKEYPPDPRVNNIRAAVPRLAYEDQDLFAVAEAMRVLRENRDRIPPVKAVYGRDLTLRHFKSRFEFAK